MANPNKGIAYQQAPPGKAAQPATPLQEWDKKAYHLWRQQMQLQKNLNHLRQDLEKLYEQLPENGRKPTGMPTVRRAAANPPAPEVKPEPAKAEAKPPVKAAGQPLPGADAAVQPKWQAVPPRKSAAEKQGPPPTDSKVQQPPPAIVVPARALAKPVEQPKPAERPRAVAALPPVTVEKPVDREPDWRLEPSLPDAATGELLPSAAAVAATAAARSVGVPAPEATKAIPQAKPAKKRRSRLSRVFSVVLTSGLAVVCLALVLYNGMLVLDKAPDVPRNTDATPYLQVLNKGELEEWEQTSVIPGQASLQMNLQIPVENGNNAEIRLINPPYSDFVYEFTLAVSQESGEETTVYSLENIIPGTVVQYAELEQPLAAGEYNGIAHYRFFDGMGLEKGSYDVEVVLKVNG